MPNMEHPRQPRLSRLPQEGDDARSVGRADQNESIPADQRLPQGSGIPQTDGPRVGKNGEYLPAEYPLVGTVEMKNGEQRTINMTRQDR